MGQTALRCAMPEPRSFAQGASVDPPSPVCHFCSALGLPHPGRGRCAFRRDPLRSSLDSVRSGLLAEDLRQERGGGDAGPEPTMGAVLEESEVEHPRPARSRRADSRPQERLRAVGLRDRASPTSTPASRAMAMASSSTGHVATSRATAGPWATCRSRAGTSARSDPSAPFVPASTIAKRTPARAAASATRSAQDVSPSARTCPPSAARTVCSVAASTAAAGRSTRPSAARSSTAEIRTSSQSARA